MNSTIIFRTFCPICTAGEFLPICARNVLARGSEPVQWAVSVNPSHAVRNTSCCAPFSARSTPCGGLFPPFLPPSAPKCRLFCPADPAVRPETPARSPRHSPAGARFPPGFRPVPRPGCRPKRARCAPFPGKPARFCPRQPGFSLVCARSLPRVPAKRHPNAAQCATAARPGGAPPPEAPPRCGYSLSRLLRFAVRKCVGPGGPRSLGAIQRRPPPPLA